MAQKKLPIVIGSMMGLLVGVVLGAALQAATSSRGVTTCPPSMETVVVAVQDISAGTVLTEEFLAQRDIPSSFVTSSWVPADMYERVIERRVLVDLQQGDAFLWSQLTPASVESGLDDDKAATEVARPVE